jgi:serine protease Do
MGMKDPVGSIVAWLVEGGPADKAGLRVADVITSFAGVVPSDERALLRAIASSLPGREADIGILRDGKPLALHVTIAEWPKMQWEQRDAPLKVAQPHWNIPPDLGLKVTPLTEDVRDKSTTPALPKGMKAALITSVTRDADAVRLGVAAGDLILEVNGVPVGNAEELQQQIDRGRADGRIFAMFLVLPKTPAVRSQWPGPKWMALRIAAG